MKGMAKTKSTGVYQYVSEDKRYEGRPDVCFYFTYKEKDTGKKKWVKVGWRSEKITAQYAADKRSEFLTQLRNGETPIQARKGKGLTYEAGFAIFRDIRFPNFKDKGEAVEQRFKIHTGPRFGKKAMNQISSLELESYKNELLEKGLAAATVRLILGDMRSVYNRLKKWGKYNGESPFENVEMPRVDNKRTRFLTHQEAGTLLAAIKAKSHKFFLISTISLETGARLGEILGASVYDLHLENRTWNIKGKTGRRTITLNDTAYNAFIEALGMRERIIIFPQRYVDHDTVALISKETGLYPTDVRYVHLDCVDLENGIVKYRRRNSGKINIYPITAAVRSIFEKHVAKYVSDLIFTAKGGQPILSTSTKTFVRAVDECGLNPAGTDPLDKVVFHTLRHTYCSWKAIKGTPLFKIARLVGHSTTAMTERYSHLCPETESRNLIEQDNTSEQLHAILSNLAAQGVEQVPQAVLDWLNTQSQVAKAV